MTKFRSIITALIIVFWGEMPGQTLSKETVVIETSMGVMKLKLYEETPKHKSNFLKLVNESFFDSLLFHRVINNFMIQGGDPLSRLAKSIDTLGNGEIGYTIQAEIKPNLIHKKGTLCAARESDDVNPKFESSACQFYIVQGKVRSEEDLKKAEDRINKATYKNAARAFIKSERGKTLKLKYDRFKSENLNDSAEQVNNLIESLIKTDVGKFPVYQFSEFQKKMYTTVGGTPHLDGTYTVFGEVIEGLEVVDKIAAVKTNGNDRPLKDIRMSLKLLK